MRALAIVISGVIIIIIKLVFFLNCHKTRKLFVYTKEPVDPTVGSTISWTNVIELIESYWWFNRLDR